MPRPNNPKSAPTKSKAYSIFLFTLKNSVLDKKNPAITPTGMILRLSTATQNVPSTKYNANLTIK